MNQVPPPRADDTTTTGVVAAGQPQAWGRALARPTGATLAQHAISVFGLGAGLAVARWLVGGDSGGAALAAGGRFFVAWLVLGTVVLALVAAIKWVATPASFARKMPVGSAMTARLGSESIGVQIGDYRHQAELGPKSRIAMRDGVMVVVAGTEKKPTVFVVPRELVPPQLAEHYLRQYGPDKG
ncbi:hypothetical protein [Mycobacterium sp. 1274756.6]|uniref:hypothetical protein n=1 Tax=Mycobacterium sp. 1274756.6 TaxID=1834076 RepID=UPI0007FCA030|nr:hypothetical protein [Mycobacterium sp. 1274756.6]OBJ69815.1 hypothetical protein A5643_11845 [Mycobacterium sp. 1274756.6]